MPGQRESILDLAPPWLLDVNGRAFLGTIGTSLDILLEKQNQAVRAKCPGLGDDAFIPLQADDRLLVQGPGESNAQFTLRLQGAFQAWRRAGSRRAVLEQMHAYLTNAQPALAVTLPECLIVGGNADLSTWHWHNIGDVPESPPAYRLVQPQNWNWDGAFTANRAWLVLYMALADVGIIGGTAVYSSVGGSGVTGVTSGFATLTGLAGLTADNEQEWITLDGFGAAGQNVGTFPIDKVLSPTSCVIANPSAVVEAVNLNWSIARYAYLQPAPVWGSNAFIWGQGNWGVTSPASLGGAAYAREVIKTIRLILKRWKSAGTYYPNIIICFQGGDGSTGNRISPLNAADGDHNPGGNYGDFGHLANGVWVPSRNYAAGDRSAFCDGTGESPQCYEKWRS